MNIKQTQHSITFNHDKCVGCVTCTLACPAHAIRVQNGKASIVKEKLCIDCGECLRICPQNAVQSMTSQQRDLSRFKIRVALPSPVLYAQFPETDTPNDILLALLSCGFDYVYDVGLTCEMALVAIDEYLRRDLRPFISNFCPSVARLIVKNYPSLIDNIIKIEVPREIAAKFARKKIAEERKIAPEDIGIFHISPCAAKIVSINNPIGIEKSNLDGAIAIRDLYEHILRALKEEREDVILQNSSGVGISWAIGRASIGGLPHRTCVSVTGVKDIIRILDDVEAGRLTNVDYLECSICPGGCVGGPLAIQNRHIANRIIQNLYEKYGIRSRVDPRKVLRHFESDYLLPSINWESQIPEPLDTNLIIASKKMNQIEQYTLSLPGKNCGACGAPTCRSLAEDVVAGDARLSDCIFIRLKELENEVARNHTIGAVNDRK
jgi:iron only hydrogenase large subunit-like protein